MSIYTYAARIRTSLKFTSSMSSKSKKSHAIFGLFSVLSFDRDRFISLTNTQLLLFTELCSLVMRLRQMQNLRVNPT